MEKISITEARNNFAKLPERTANDQIIAVTRRNKEIMAVMSWELYEGVLETLEIMADSELRGHIKRALAEIQSGKTYSVEEARKRLGL